MPNSHPIQPLHSFASSSSTIATLIDHRYSTHFSAYLKIKINLFISGNNKSGEALTLDSLCSFQLVYPLQGIKSLRFYTINSRSAIDEQFMSAENTKVAPPALNSDSTSKNQTPATTTTIFKMDAIQSSVLKTVIEGIPLLTM
ncbi:hypothetical protein PGT21_031360 [Puccinia graminis f. sp. tritici]|uniref:Uncharacterized protein n=1 Tax=Puccinia graminis f. sp. tritici TaxID=56615 RepID=A0A5B0PJM8_PUCGR|nr:hypothetical protein PGT21_031360 [Puccinia graminis f. sp. tritici]